MPFVNDVLAENQDRSEALKSLAAEPRQTRFLFDPDAVLELLRRRIVGQPEMHAAVGDMLQVVKADFAEVQEAARSVSPSGIEWGGENGNRPGAGGGHSWKCGQAFPH